MRIERRFRLKGNSGQLRLFEKVDLLISLARLPLRRRDRQGVESVRAIIGRKFRTRPLRPAPRGLFLWLVQLLLDLAVTLVGRADALPIELEALID
jgi:hypothetical protein